MKYAETADVEAGFRPLDVDERIRCSVLLEEAAVIIDTYSETADPARKKLVSCRMVRRQLDTGGGAGMYPLGASQGSASALGYTQNWTMSGGAVGELYLSKLEKRLLGAGDRIGARSPLEGMVAE